jgi:hypothetical protein
LTNDPSESSELFRSSPNADFEHSGAFITSKSLPAYLPLNAVRKRDSNIVIPLAI